MLSVLLEIPVFKGTIATHNILLPLTDPDVQEFIPVTTFNSPEGVASIGLHEAQVVERYGRAKVDVASKPLAKVDRAVCDNASGNGFFKSGVFQTEMGESWVPPWFVHLTVKSWVKLPWPR